MLIFIALIFSLITEFLLAGKTKQGNISSEEIFEMKSEIKQISEDIKELKEH